MNLSDILEIVTFNASFIIIFWSAQKNLVKAANLISAGSGAVKVWFCVIFSHVHLLYKKLPDGVVTLGDDILWED